VHPPKQAPDGDCAHGECGHYTGFVGGTAPEWIPANTHQQHERDESRYQENREDQEQTPHQIKLSHSPNVFHVDIMRQGTQTKARTVVNRRFHSMRAESLVNERNRDVSPTIHRFVT